MKVQCMSCGHKQESGLKECKSCKSPMPGDPIAAEPPKKKGQKVNKQWITESNAFIDKKLQSELSANKGLLYPDDAFYSGGGLDNMTSIILSHLGIELEPGELVIEFQKKLPAPGLYTEIEGQKVILIKEHYKDDKFATAAILAHELMHFYLIGKKNLKMDDVLENELLTDLCTIRFGLGLIIINGMSAKNNWLFSIMAIFFGVIYWSSQKLSFGYFDPKQYGQLVYDYLQEKHLSLQEYAGHIRPVSRNFFPVQFWKFWRLDKTPEVIKGLIKRQKKWFVLKVVALGFIIVFAVNGIIEDNQLEAQMVQILQYEDQLETLDDDLSPQAEALIIKFDSSTQEEADVIADLLLEENPKLYSTLDTYFYEYELLYESYSDLVDDYNSKI